MIRVPRRKASRPADLDGPTSKGERERADAESFYADPANAGKTYPFKAYKEGSVKRALNEIFHYKCAYCESVYGATQPVDIEHFRPKAAVVHQGRLRKPGYYWLAADWDNLLPSCIDCNRPRTQEFPDADPELAGKANLFPLATETARAAAPGEERQERRLLLHPCRDFPDKHLEFLDDGTVRPRRSSSGHLSDKGVCSIRAYGLRRTVLSQEREGRSRLILAHVASVNDILQLMDDRPGDPTLERMLEREMAMLKVFQESDAEYTGMARQIIERVLHID